MRSLPGSIPRSAADPGNRPLQACKPDTAEPGGGLVVGRAGAGRQGEVGVGEGEQRVEGVLYRVHTGAIIHVNLANRLALLVGENKHLQRV